MGAIAVRAHGRLPPADRHGTVRRRRAPPRRSTARSLDLARADGVKVYDGHAFAGVPSERPDRVVVDVDALGAVAGRYVVAADGMWSPVRKALGLGDAGLPR